MDISYIKQEKPEDYELILPADFVNDDETSDAENADHPQLNSIKDEGMWFNLKLILSYHSCCFSYRYCHILRRSLHT